MWLADLDMAVCSSSSGGCDGGCGSGGTDDVEVNSVGRVSGGLMGLPDSSVESKLDSVEGEPNEVVRLQRLVVGVVRKRPNMSWRH